MEGDETSPEISPLHITEALDQNLNAVYDTKNRTQGKRENYRNSWIQNSLETSESVPGDITLQEAQNKMLGCNFFNIDITIGRTYGTDFEDKQQSRSQSLEGKAPLYKRTALPQDQGKQKKDSFLEKSNTSVRINTNTSDTYRASSEKTLYLTKAVSCT